MKNQCIFKGAKCLAVTNVPKFISQHNRKYMCIFILPCLQIISDSSFLSRKFNMKSAIF